MTRILSSICFVLALASATLAAEPTAPTKQLWAKSFLGQKAPDLVVEKWLTAQPDTKGKFVLIDFWATWCGPCRKAIPDLNKFHKQFGEKLVVIGVSKESEEAILKMKEPVIEYASAIDTQGRMSKQLEVKGIPHVIVIDPQGVVRWEGYPLLGGHELTEAVIEELLKK